LTGVSIYLSYIMNSLNHLLEVSGLSVTVGHSSVPQPLVDNVSLSLRSGALLAIVGRSGSGKSTLCRSLTKLQSHPSTLRITGKVCFNGIDILESEVELLRTIRRQSVRYIFQDPLQALNPLASVRSQLRLSSSDIGEEFLNEALNSVGLSPDVWNLYPHQLSIGMAQRVAIAMAVLPKTKLLIADEPTSALDSTNRFQILDLLKSIQQKHSMAMILVTHDLEIARRYADQIAVMLEGRIVEQGPCAEFFATPRHEYSKQLIDSMLVSRALNRTNMRSV
jgi:microcin C transport system ATP-binding protein